MSTERVGKKAGDGGNEGTGETAGKHSFPLQDGGDVEKEPSSSRMRVRGGRLCQPYPQGDEDNRQGEIIVMSTKGYTAFTDLEAENIKATGGFAGNIVGNVTGHLAGITKLEKAADYALSAAESAKPIISLKTTVANKIFTLGLPEGHTAVVYNHGTETLKVKNVTGDTATDLATTKALLIVGGGSTANTNIIIALN